MTLSPPPGADGVRLTKAQRWVLETLAGRPFGGRVYHMGRPSCEALRKRGLIDSSGGDRPIGKFDGNPIVKINEAGRAALSTPPKENDHE